MFFIYLNLFKGMCVCVCVCVYVCVYVCVCVCVCSNPEFSLVDPPLISSLLVLQGKQRVLVDELTPLLEVSSFQQGYLILFSLSSSFELGSRPYPK